MCIVIGFSPNQLNDHANHARLGFFLTAARMQTSVPGLFAVGDIRAQPVRQITNATADGPVAAVMAHKYLEDRQLLVGGAGAGRGAGIEVQVFMKACPKLLDLGAARPYAHIGVTYRAGGYGQGTRPQFTLHDFPFPG